MHTCTNCIPYTDLYCWFPIHVLTAYTLHWLVLLVPCGCWLDLLVPYVCTNCILYTDLYCWFPIQRFILSVHIDVILGNITGSPCIHVLTAYLTPTCTAGSPFSILCVVTSRWYYWFLMHTYTNCIPYTDLHCLFPMHTGTNCIPYTDLHCLFPMHTGTNCIPYTDLYW